MNKRVLMERTSVKGFYRASKAVQANTGLYRVITCVEEELNGGWSVLWGSTGVEGGDRVQGC